MNLTKDENYMLDEILDYWYGDEYFDFDGVPQTNYIDPNWLYKYLTGKFDDEE